MTPEQLAEIERWFGMDRDDTYQHGQALLAEVKRLQAARGGWFTAEAMIERALRKGYDLDPHDLADALGIDVGEVSR